MPKISKNCFSCNLLECFRQPPKRITCHVRENSHVESNQQSVDPMEGRFNFHEENPTELDECNLQGVRIPADSVAVMAYSTDPYVQFREAMTEMLQYRLERRMLVDWDYLEELLTCYLELNERNCHGDLLMAYVDVVTEFYRQGM